MVIYFFVAILLTLFVFLDFYVERSVRLLFLFLGGAVLAFYLGLRQETGTDWEAYEDHFYGLVLEDVDVQYNFDIGYEYFAYFFSFLGFSYESFLFLYTCLTLLFFCLAFSTLRHPSIALFVLYMNYLVPLMGTLRQLMAVSLLVLAFVELNSRVNLKTTILVVVSGLFHKSAFFVAWLGSEKIKAFKFTLTKFIVALVLGYAVFLYKETVFNYVYSFFTFSETISSKISDYFVSDHSRPIFYVENKSIVFLMFLKRVSVFLLLLILWKKEKSSVMLRYVVNIYGVGLLIFLLLYNIFPAIAVRVSIYFTIVEVIGLASASYRVLAQRLVLIVFFVLCFFNLYSVLTGVDADLLVPYKGWFINSDHYRVLR